VLAGGVPSVEMTLHWRSPRAALTGVPAGISNQSRGSLPTNRQTSNLENGVPVFYKISCSMLGLGFPFSVKIILLRNTKQGAIAVSFEFRLLQEDSNVQNSFYVL
jgi:hypothetical protein